jgi:uncharacterized membrane protein (UPF0182 family)
MSRRRVALYAVATVFVVLFGGRFLAIRYTEASWFADLGMAREYWARLFHDLGWQLAVAAGATLWYAAQTFGVYRSIGAVHLPRRVGDLEIAEAVPRRTLRWIAIALALLLGIVTAVTFADLPDLITLARHATPLDLREPILGRDASFYLATLPLLEKLHLAALALVLFAIFVAAALYALTGSITYGARRLRMTPHARVHLIVLAACLALVLAWGFQLDAFGIVGGGGSANGALSPADRAIRLPASAALAALSLVVAAGSVATLRLRRTGVLLAAWATLALVAVLGRFVAPYLWEAWRGRPDPEVALALAQYDDRCSRAGLGVLDAVSDERLGARAAVPDDSLAALGRDLGGVSPWALEPELLEAALSAGLTDSERPRAWTVTLDVYGGAGASPRLVALAVPETDALGLERAPRRPDWTASHRGPLSWAGEPVAVAADVDAAGLSFLTRPDVATGTAAPVPLTRAPGRIRYLARAAESAIVGPDEPTAPGGPAGLRLGGFVRRLLLAWALQSPPLLDRRTSVADRLLVWRDVPRRLERLYPFASFDAPRATLVEGRLLWVSDGYLASARFPLAEHVPWNGDAVNFLRAAFVAIVDAVSGRTRLYLRPPDLAFASALAEGYGTAPLPSDSLGPELKAHLGYPEQLFGAQVEMVARHRGDAGDERWIVARQEPDQATPGNEGRALRPAAEVLLSLDGGPPALWRLAPLADAAGNSLVAIAAGAARPDGTPWMRLLRLTGGPFPTVAAAATRFASAPAVVAAVAGAAGPDGAVRRSAVAALPAAGTVAYLQFLFASQRRAQDPLMPRGAALLASGRLGVGDGVRSAAEALASGRGAPAASFAGAAASFKEARAAFAALDSASRRGDWAAFARAYEALRRVLGAPPAGARWP